MVTLGLVVLLLYTTESSLGQSSHSVRPNSTHANAEACYLHEIDPRTNRTFVSQDEYASELRRWNSVSQSAVGPFDLAIAYSTYLSEKAHAKTLATDKSMHCYIGCVIGLSTSAKVADYVGWFKEFQDLTDCDSTTRFEDADSIATSQGARLGARDRIECSNLCVGEFPRRPRRGASR